MMKSMLPLIILPENVYNSNCISFGRFKWSYKKVSHRHLLFWKRQYTTWDWRDCGKLNMVNVLLKKYSCT